LSQLTRIIAVVIDTKMFTCYLPDGRSLSILQGDPRTTKILAAMPDIEEHGHADVDLSQANPYRDFESQVGGAIRFFRVLRTKLNEVFDEMEKVAPLFDPTTGETVPAQTVGTIPAVSQPAPADPLPVDAAAPADEEEPAPPAPRVIPDENKAAAVADIMKHAQPASDPTFEPAATQPSETMVAVLPDNSIVPDVEKIQDHLTHSVKIGSSIGVEKMLARLAAVIHDRKHSVEDVMRFMQKNDLPVADDGSLIVYKVLKKRNGTYFDCHTGSVPQRIGSFVNVKVDLIDLNRRNECSAGLHVARRGYIAGFGGDVCTIVKVAPEDVFVVPHGDPNKVRVRGYHILMELDQDSWNKLKNNVPMTDNPKAAKMLARAVSGDHVGIIEDVLITESMGGGVKVTPVGEKKEVAKQVGEALALDDKRMKSADTVAVEHTKVEDVQQAISDKVAQAANGRQAKAQDLWNTVLSATGEARKVAAQELLKFKKAAKVSWDKLGINQSQVETLLEVATSDVTEAPAPEPEPLDLTPEMQAPAAPQAQAAPQGQPEGRKEKATRLLAAVKNTNDDPLGRSNAAKELLALKKSSKIGWDRLGLTQADVDLVTKAAG
jgi:hypothetical protein